MKKLLLTIIIYSVTNFTIYGSGFGFTFEKHNFFQNFSIIDNQPILTPNLSQTLYYLSKTITRIQGREIKGISFEPSISYRSSTISKNITSLTILGLGSLSTISNKDNFKTYYGNRIGIVYTGNIIDLLSFKNSEQNVYILAPIYGSEYIFNENFSIGGEMRFNFIFFPDNDSINEISTHLFFRFRN